MLTVKLSDKPCLFCGAKEETVFAKSKENDFTGNVCAKHLIALLKRWEGQEASKETPKDKVA